jgi:5-methylcytosine-specific restriction enzyme A
VYFRHFKLKIKGIVMSRKKFIEANGATCDNWTWSWSFVNHEDKVVIFGAWEVEQDGMMVKILARDWEFDDNGRKKSGYGQALRHIQLVAENGYQLMTFPQKHPDDWDRDSNAGVAVIDGFSPTLQPRDLITVEDSWYALDSIAWEPSEDFESYVKRSDVIRFSNRGENVLAKPEGNERPSTTSSSTTLYYRDPAVRAWVLSENDGSCEACGNDAPFSTLDGSPFLEVHHLVRLADGGPDVVENALAVCPNCHRRLHHSADRDEFLSDVYTNNTRLVKY